MIVPAFDNRSVQHCSKWTDPFCYQATRTKVYRPAQMHVSHEGLQANLLCMSLVHVGYVLFAYNWVYPAVSAHSLAFPWQQMWLRVMHVWLGKRTFDNHDNSEHLPYKSKPSAKIGVPCHKQDANSHREGVYAVTSQWPCLQIIMFHQRIMQLSCDFSPLGQLHQVLQQNVAWVLKKNRNLVAKVDLSRFSSREKLIPSSRKEIWWAEYVPDCTNSSLRDVTRQ